MSVKKIIKKLPFLSSFSKIVYDYRRERALDKRIRNFLAGGRLPFSDKAPEKYSVGYEPTIRCNLKCKMCYQGQTRALRRNELAANESVEVFNKLKRRVKEVKMVGGEPFARSDIFDLISFWDKEGERIILQTNLTLLGEKGVEKLKDYKHVSDILTSLDGPPEVHDAVRGVPGSFAKLKESILSLKKHRPDIPITIFATMLLNDDFAPLFRLVDTVKDLGVGTINVLFEQVYNAGEIKAAREIFKKEFGWEDGSYRLNTQMRDPSFEPSLDASAIRKNLDKLRRYGFAKKCFVNFVPFDYYKNVDIYLGKKKARVFCLKLMAPELRINQTGDVIWCDVIEKSFGNLMDKTPDEIWMSEEYQKFRKRLFEKGGFPICYRCCKAQYVKQK
ncbi:MAG: radical SAM protein [Candidatus Paceibacter sp.]|nr:radical SAM protein [Candidatus Paceibacter sp.]